MMLGKFAGLTAVVSGLILGAVLSQPVAAEDAAAQPQQPAAAEKTAAKPDDAKADEAKDDGKLALKQDKPAVIDPSQPVSLMALYDAATNSSPSLKAAQAGSEAADYSLRDAWFGYLPRVTLSYDRQRERQSVHRTDNPVYKVGEGVFANYDRTFQIVQPIFDARQFAQINAAYAGSHYADAQLVAARQKNTYNIVEAYLLALASVDDVRLSKSELAALQGHVDEVSRRLSKGMGSRTELEDVQARAAKAEADEVAAEANFDKALVALRRLTGQKVEKLTPLSGDIAMAAPIPADPEDWIDNAHKGNADLRAADASVEQAQAVLQKSYADLAPRVELSASDDRLDSGGSLYGGGALTNQKVLEARLTIPLFNPDGQGYTAYSSTAKLRQSRYNRDDKTLEVDQKVRAAFLEVQKNARGGASLVKSAKHRGQYADDLHNKFTAGMATTSDMLDAERDFFRVQREVLSSHYNYLLNMMQLKQLTGQISGDDVVYVDSLLVK